MDLQIPRVVTIMGHPFRIHVRTKDESLFRGAPDTAMGSNDLNLEVINVRGPEDLSPMGAVDTVTHEVLHGVFWLHGLRRFLKDEHSDEDIVGVLATALVAVMRENPELVDFIMTDVSRALSGEIVTTDHDH